MAATPQELSQSLSPKHCAEVKRQQFQEKTNIVKNDVEETPQYVADGGHPSDEHPSGPKVELKQKETNSTMSAEKELPNNAEEVFTASEAEARNGHSTLHST